MERRRAVTPLEAFIEQATQGYHVSDFHRVDCTGVEALQLAWHLRQDVNRNELDAIVATAARLRNGVLWSPTTNYIPVDNVQLVKRDIIDSGVPYYIQLFEFMGNVASSGMIYGLIAYHGATERYVTPKNAAHVYSTLPFPVVNWTMKPLLERIAHGIRTHERQFPWKPGRNDKGVA